MKTASLHGIIEMMAGAILDRIIEAGIGVDHRMTPITLGRSLSGIWRMQWALDVAGLDQEELEAIYGDVSNGRPLGGEHTVWPFDQQKEENAND